MSQQTLEARRAVEALRSGVPSAAAVRTLGSGQERLEQQFRTLLSRSEFETRAQVPGLLLRGGFGEGKSHLLTCFERIALDGGFAVSRVVISKETPLQMPNKVLASAAETMRVPNTLGQGLQELAILLRKRTGAPEYRNLLEDSALDSRFGASLCLFEHAGEELEDRIVRFWSGDKLIVSEVRAELRNLEMGNRFPLASIRARDLALQTMSFIPRLVRAAGLKGWVLLLDEIELIGRYSRLARGRAYAELARWLVGQGDPRPGLITVAAITSDFTQEILRGAQDLDQMGPWLDYRDPEAAPGAREGMRLIEQCIELTSPDDALLQRSYKILQELHGRAYSWSPPDVPWPEVLGSMPMRTFVRAWINGWDVHRLYPQIRPESLRYDVTPMKTEYGEHPDLEEAELDAE